MAQKELPEWTEAELTASLAFQGDAHDQAIAILAAQRRIIQRAIEAADAALDVVVATRSTVAYNFPGLVPRDTNRRLMAQAASDTDSMMLPFIAKYRAVSNGLDAGLIPEDAGLAIVIDPKLVAITQT
ncbi:MAG: hypothetical protein ACFBZ9_11965 [Sphingomonadales bacterium]